MFKVQLIAHYYHRGIYCLQQRGCTQKDNTDLMLNGQHGQGFEPLASTQNGPGFGSASGSAFLKSGEKDKIRNTLVSLPLV